MAGERCHRICATPGCRNLGRPKGKLKRHPWCGRCQRDKSTSSDANERARIRRRNSVRLKDGRKAAQDLRRLLRGGQVRSTSRHHRAVRLHLGGEVHDGLTVSRICPPDCPEAYRSSSDYPLCRDPNHYVLESLADNLARGPHGEEANV